MTEPEARIRRAVVLLKSWRACAQDEYDAINGTPMGRVERMVNLLSEVAYFNRLLSILESGIDPEVEKP